MPDSPANLPPNLSGMFGDLFGELLSGHATNLSVDLALTDAEAASGVTRDVVIPRFRACAVCAGRGSKNVAVVPVDCAQCQATGKTEVTQGFFKLQTTCATCKGVGKTIAEPCGTCSGTGRASYDATVSVVVPAHVEHGQILTLDGQGSTGADGAAGALYVTMVVGGRPYPRDELFAAHQAAQANLPTAEVHRPPMPTWQVALIGVVTLALLAALILAR